MKKSQLQTVKEKSLLQMLVSWRNAFALATLIVFCSSAYWFHSTYYSVMSPDQPKVGSDRWSDEERKDILSKNLCPEHFDFYKTKIHYDCLLCMKWVISSTAIAFKIALKPIYTE